MQTFIRSIRAALIALSCSLGLLTLAYGQVSVTTYHNDNGRTGQNVKETTLTPGNVRVATFGKVFTGSVSLDSWAAAQPLYVANVTISGTAHNVVYIATLNNTVYAFDANNGLLLWMQNYGTPTPYTTLCNDSAFQNSPSKGAGIVGTPVIDPVAGTMYFVAKTGATSSSFALSLHAVDITTGNERNGSPVAVIPPSGPTFYPRYQMNRPGLLLNNGMVYFALGSTGCTGLGYFPAINNHGWVLGYNTGNLTQTPLTFVTTPNTDNGGIWQSGGGLVADSSGNIYFETADAVFDQYTGGLDFGDSILKLDSNLNLVDFFTPYNQQTLNADDTELGSVGPVLLPDQSVGPTHLLVGSAKTEEVFVVNRDDLGGFCSACTTTNSNIVQDIPRPSYLTGCLPPASGGATTCRYGPLSYWNNTVYVPGENAPMLAYPMSSGTLATTPLAATNFHGGIGSPSISANGSSNGILWAVAWGPSPGNLGVLHAFNAVTMAGLYSSAAAPNGRDTLGAVAHFVTPTVANGKVYVATRTQLVVYGLLGK